MIRRDESGQVALLVLGLALVAFAIGGVAVDGTRAFLLRRTMQNAADAAAVAAAGELHVSRYYASGGDDIGIDASSARRTALEWLGKRGVKARYGIAVQDDGVHIVLREELPTTFLGLVGVRSIPVAVEAAAAPVGVPAAR